MKFKFRMLPLLFLIYCSFGFAQELSRNELSQLSYDSIISIENDLSFGDSYLLKVFDVHIAKAKFLKDTFQLANTYRKRAWSEDFDNAIKYVDSAIFISKYMADLNFSSKAHYTKGVLYYEASKPEESVIHLIEAFKFAKQIDNHEFIVDCLNLISSIKREFGEEEEATVLQEESYRYLLRHKSKIDSYDLTHLITLDNLARCYLQKGMIDSVRNVSEKAMSLALKIEDLDAFKKMGILNAQANYYDGNFLKAKDSLIKYNSDYEGVTKADILFYLGKIEGQIQNVDKKEIHFKAIDSILISEDYPLIDNVKEVYQYLFKQSISKENDIKREYYADRMIYYDSLIDFTERKLRNLTLLKFDIPFQKEKIDLLETEISRQIKFKSILFATVGIIVLIVLLISFRLIKTAQRLKNIMNVRAMPVSLAPDEMKKVEIGIDEEIVNKTIKDLEKWEAELGFLNPDVNQNSLAVKLNTNSTYLSKIVNIIKKQSFSNYIKDLRITYTINYLKDNPDFIKNKSTIQVAEYFGFNSIDVFIRALKKKAGITPAVFFKKLKQGNL